MTRQPGGWKMSNDPTCPRAGQPLEVVTCGVFCRRRGGRDVDHVCGEHCSGPVHQRLVPRARELDDCSPGATISTTGDHDACRTTGDHDGVERVITMAWRVQSRARSGWTRAPQYDSAMPSRPTILARRPPFRVRREPAGDTTLTPPRMDHAPNASGTPLSGTVATTPAST